MKTLFKLYKMKYLPVLLVFNLLISCNSSTKKETEITRDSKIISKEQKDAPINRSGDYSTLLIDYQCDMSAEEISEILQIPNIDIEQISSPNPKACIFRFSRNGNYESNLTLSLEPGSKKGNKKAITKALNEKEANQAVLGNDIILADTDDCYFMYIPISGRIYIRNENYDGVFQLFYGSRGKRTKEQHEELRQKMTDLANYILKKHRK